LLGQGQSSDQAPTWQDPAYKLRPSTQFSSYLKQNTAFLLKMYDKAYNEYLEAEKQVVIAQGEIDRANIRIAQLAKEKQDLRSQSSQHRLAYEKERSNTYALQRHLKSLQQNLAVATQQRDELRNRLQNAGLATNVDLSMVMMDYEAAKSQRDNAQAALRALQNEHNDALKQLSEVDNRINAAVAANNKMHSKESPMESYSKMQMKTLKSMGIGSISNRQSFGLAGLTMLLGITAIIGRVE